MLFALFAPSRANKRVFAVLTAALERKTLSAKIIATCFSGVRQYPLAQIGGMIPGALLAFLSFVGSDQANEKLAILWIALGLLIAFAGGFAAVVTTLLYKFIKYLPRNNYGLCNGMTDDVASRKSSSEALTDWLSRYLNELAGRSNDRPLTFGDLWGPAGIADPEKRETNLEMMTTNLTHGRPYRLPFRNDEDVRENHLFYFNKAEFQALFPKDVVAWMIDNPRTIQPGSDITGKRAAERKLRAESGFHPLPDPENLPVIVATRMSLSFPVLLSMVPLYTVDYSRDSSQTRLERCWFSDGGVCSNFPIHFFDSPLPRRPTFSIDLTSVPDDTKDLKPAMDKSNNPQLDDQWNLFDKKTFADKAKSPKEKSNLGKLFGFASALVSTMQNWNDATQGRLPGYRDRIVRIPLTSELGGLNLNMPQCRVEFLSQQGNLSAQEILKHFDVPATNSVMTWENHRWIRLRSMFASLEKMVDTTIAACDHPEKGDLGYEDWLRDIASDPNKAPSYPMSKRQIRSAIETLKKLREIQDLWTAQNTSATRAPKPRPELRPRAQI